MVAAGLGLAATLSVARAIPALAAIEAGLPTSEAQPGVRVTLITQDNGYLTAYSDLAASGPEPVYLVSTADFAKEIARYGSQRCGAPEQRYLGKLTWVGDTGSLSFRVPDVPKGDYYFELTVPYASPQCWRTGAPSGPLVLTIDQAGPSGGPVPGGAGTPTWVALIAVGALVIARGVLVGVGLRARSGRETRRRIPPPGTSGMRLRRFPSRVARRGKDVEAVTDRIMGLP